MENKNLVEYLTTKYYEDFDPPFDNSIYNNAEINEYFHKFSGYIEGNESRKCGIKNDDDGLLLILALIMDKVELASTKWDAK